jgi:hypothetical protein
LFGDSALARRDNARFGGGWQGFAVTLCLIGIGIGNGDGFAHTALLVIFFGFRSGYNIDTLSGFFVVIRAFIGYLRSVLFGLRHFNHHWTLSFLIRLRPVSPNKFKKRLTAVQPAEAAKSAAQENMIAQFSCPVLPKVEWLKSTHAKIVRYVDKSFRVIGTPILPSGSTTGPRCKKFTTGMVRPRLNPAISG